MKKYIIVLLMTSFCILDSYCQTLEIEYYPEQRGAFRILEINKKKSLITIFAERIDSVDMTIDKHKSMKQRDVVMIVSIVRDGVKGEKLKKNRIYNLTLNSLYVKSINGIGEPLNRLDYYIYYHGFHLNPMSKYHTYDIFESKQIAGKYFSEQSFELGN